MRNLSRTLVIPLLLLLVVAGVWAVWMSSRPSKQAPAERAFDADVWLRADERLRGTMVNDLLRRGDMTGKDKSAVRTILGDPTAEHERDWYYRVDIGQRFIDSPWHYSLRIEFDERTGKVKSAELMD